MRKKEVLNRLPVAGNTSTIVCAICSGKGLPVHFDNHTSDERQPT
jgi:hypothetical protein